jgi:nicotinamide riboside transporter PnuC
MTCTRLLTCVYTFHSPRTPLGLFNWSMQFQNGEEKEKPAQMSTEEYDAQKLKWYAFHLCTKQCRV